MQKPVLMTFDMFGTVVDWRTGLERACAAAGRRLRGGEFDRIIDFQGRLEQGPFLTYAEITRRSLIEVVGLPEETAAAIGATVGHWPLYPDSHDAMRALMRIAPCAAMTNSDRAHGEQLQAQLGLHIDDWLCAEDVRIYKPNPAFWYEMAARRKLALGPSWWHVSAYADYDLAVAASLGLTTVFVDRPHARAGAASITVYDLTELVDLLKPTGSGSIGPA